MRIAAVFALVLGLAVTAAAQAPSWSYAGKSGPINWGRLDPANSACSQGREQSPVDIRGARADKGLTPLDFHFLSGPVTMENTGNQIVAHIRPGGTLTAEGVQYQLQDIVFHHPSEHPVKGQFTDMDLDMMYKSADGKAAAVSVRLTLERGSANAIIASLWEHMPAAPGGKEEVSEPVNMGGLLPPDRSYWTYTGSLTNPPCTEGVRWYILEQPLSVSREQVRQFVSMFRINSRPLQETRGRKIRAFE